MFFQKFFKRRAEAKAKAAADAAADAAALAAAAKGPRIPEGKIDRDCLGCLRRLRQNGYTAYLVGGGVRDLLLGRTPKDFDIVTNARPQQIRRLFRNAFVIGKRFQLVLICFGPRRQKQIETATFRRDSAPDAAGAPGSERMGALYQKTDNAFGTPREDAFRRDFTVNALFWNPADGTIIDYTGGLKDIESRTLRCIGDPQVRFREDPVRMLRAVRLSTRLGFSIDAESTAAIRKWGAEIVNASRPRLFEELTRLFTFAHSFDAFHRLWQLGLMAHLVPSVAQYVDRTGGEASPLWAWLKALDAAVPSLNTEDTSRPDYVGENVLRLATLLAPLWCETLEKAAAKTEDGTLARVTRDKLQELAEDIVKKQFTMPFSSSGWRIPKALCFDLQDVLVSFALYTRGVHGLRARTVLPRSWFYTALTFWRIANAVAPADAATAAIESWAHDYDEFRVNNPVLARDDARAARDETFPGNADPAAPNRRRRRRRRR